MLTASGSIVGIRPKIFLANDGNYREMRWFTPWHIDPSNPGALQYLVFLLACRIAVLIGVG